MGKTIWHATLTHCLTYKSAEVEYAVEQALEASGWRPPRGLVLVKPNLLRAIPLACTQPEVIVAVCRWLLDHGTHVVVADSPGFGTVRGVSHAIGLDAALTPLGLRVRTLKDAVPVALRGGGNWHVARIALEADALVSIPRVKAHAQMRLTFAVKNLFGCICGLGKVMAHARQGNSLEYFSDSIVDLWRALPPVAAVMDGVIAMHRTGPSSGKAYSLGCIGVSASAVALDVALYRMLNMRPEQIPLWAALQRAGVAEAREEAFYPLCLPKDFSTQGFIVPEILQDISFCPSRLVSSIVRRCWRRLWS